MQRGNITQENADCPDLFPDNADIKRSADNDEAGKTNENYSIEIDSCKRVDEFEQKTKYIVNASANKKEGAVGVQTYFAASALQQEVVKRIRHLLIN